EVPLHRDPGTASGNAHLLVVVAGRAAGREGVAEPEVVLRGDAVGDIGEGCGALVRGHYKVGIVFVVALNVSRRYHPALLEVVGEVQQATDENSVAGNRLGHHLVARTARW